MSGITTLDAGEVIDLSLAQTHSLKEIGQNLVLLNDTQIWLAAETGPLGLNWDEPAQELRAMVVDNVPGIAQPGRWHHEIKRYITTLEQIIEACTPLV